jgi:hypothetical protein
VGTILDCDGLASALEDFGNSSSLSFKQFETYLSKEVFSCIGDSLCRKELSILEKQIDEACWQISKAKLIADSIKRNPRLGNESIFKLFRIFCVLGDLIMDSDISQTDNAQVSTVCI